MRLLLSILLFFTVTSVHAESPTLTVTGEGSASLAPDHAQLAATVSMISMEAGSAQRQVDTTTEAIRAALLELHVDPDSLDTTDLRVAPRYRWQRETQQQVFEGYEVTRTIRIVLEDLSELGSAYQRMVDHGATQIEPARLDSHARAVAERTALRQAYRDAKAQADALADETGMTVDSVAQISTITLESPRPVIAMARAASESAGGPGYDPGELQVMRRVHVVFELAASN